jgi:hypothetical protein
MKEESYKPLNEFKHDSNKELTELKENSNKQVNEIKKIMQDMKVEFYKDTEILKNIKLKS